MDVYRVNCREWFPTREEALADAEAAGEPNLGEEIGRQAEDGSVQVVQIIAY